MIVDYGLYKKVYIFKDWVIKVPRTLKGIMAIYSEHYLYFKVDKKYRYLLLPNYFVPIIPISIQRRVEVFEWDNVDEIPYEYLDKENILGWEAFTDCKPINFGRYKDRIYKIDYDFNYIWHNFKINIFGFDENNTEMKIYLCLKKKLKEVFKW